LTALIYTIKFDRTDHLRQIQPENFIAAFGDILCGDYTDIYTRMAVLAKHYTKLSEGADDLQQIFVDNAAAPELAQLMSDAWLETTMGEV
jgi:hypothetical protein